MKKKRHIKTITFFPHRLLWNLVTPRATILEYDRYLKHLSLRILFFQLLVNSFTSFQLKWKLTCSRSMKTRAESRELLLIVLKVGTDEKMFDRRSCSQFNWLHKFNFPFSPKCQFKTISLNCKHEKRETKTWKKKNTHKQNVRTANDWMNLIIKLSIALLLQQQWDHETRMAKYLNEKRIVPKWSTREKRKQKKKKKERWFH